MKKTYWVPMFLAFVVTAYLALWPVPIKAVTWHAPATSGLTGTFVANTRLANAKNIVLNGELGPEHVMLGPDGKLYTGVASGRILRMALDGSAQETFAATGGRPLGLAFDASGGLVVADAFKGLLSVAADGKQTVLVKAGEGGEVAFPNAVTVASNGKIYFTDSSTRFTPQRWGTTQEAAMLDVFEQSASGRVLEYDPQAKRVRVVAAGLSLPNGIALSSDEAHLFVSESGRYRVWQVDTAAVQLDMSKPSPLARVLLDNLPGFPDNLTRGLDGKTWLGLAGQRNELDLMAERPFFRQMVLRIPRFMWAMPKPFGHVIAFKDDGTVVADLQDPSGNSPTTTGVTETAERLYIQSVDAKSLGWMTRQGM
jgi:sugar lactone lactonase YvrE